MPYRVTFLWRSAMQIIKHHFVDGKIYHKEFTLDDSEIITQHKHMFDHVTLLTSGSIIVTVAGQQSLHHAPDYVFIKAGEHHQIEAFDGSARLFCTHITDCTDPEQIDHTLIMRNEHG
jgi:quercetin dioxygenase-like cupin family protein